MDRVQATRPETRLTAARLAASSIAITKFKCRSHVQRSLTYIDSMTRTGSCNVTIFYHFRPLHSIHYTHWMNLRSGEDDESTTEQDCEIRDTKVNKSA